MEFTGVKKPVRFVAKPAVLSINCQEMRLDTPQGKIHFEVTGEGPPLVFVSGWAMSGDCWRPSVHLLARRHRCLIYDSRGIGRSQPVPVNAGFGIEDLADDLHLLIQSTAAYDATIIGHDLGALVAAICARRHPQDLSSLIVVSPRPPMAEPDLRKLAVITPASLALREMAAYPVIRNLVAWRFHRAPKPYREKLYDDFAGLNPRAAYETALSVANLDPAYQLDLSIEKGGFPVLAVCGERDKKGVEQARILFSRVKSGRLATLRDCGFLPMLEYPRQFARLIENFVTAQQHTRRRSLERRSSQGEKKH
ncbi:MAG TPA: alpha/beta hydrolase [Blastocatellia bacterium]|nr:alpha/beta hydrolase [Blastocatellia bacterium]